MGTPPRGVPDPLNRGLGVLSVDPGGRLRRQGHDGLMLAETALRRAPDGGLLWSVGSGQDQSQILYPDPRVDGRRLQAPMAEELLDVADVGAAGQKVRGAGVPQGMDGRAARDLPRTAVLPRYRSTA